MDLLCRFCREPWDNETIHEEVAERIRQDLPTSTWAAKVWPLNIGRQPTYDSVAAEFRRYGCGAFPAFTGNVEIAGTNGLLIVRKCRDSSTADPDLSALYQLLGDDMDGAAAMIEDYGLA